MGLSSIKVIRLLCLSNLLGREQVQRLILVYIIQANSITSSHFPLFDDVSIRFSSNIGTNSTRCTDCYNDTSDINYSALK